MPSPTSDLNRELIEDIAELVVKRMKQLWERERRRARRQQQERELWEDDD